MIISAKTKISDIIKENEKAIEVIASINSHFLKLKNPILRKLLASKVTVEQASRIGRVTSELMLEKLKDIGFEISKSPSEKEYPTSFNSFIFDKGKVNVLDVRPIISSGKDPFALIMKSLKELPADYTLLLINSFEPTPLINILSSKGYACLVERKSDNLYYTYFKKEVEVSVEPEPETIPDEFEKLLSKYESNIKTIDVRELEMPYPMITILNEITELENGSALLVMHKRIPQFLFPKLDEQKCLYAYKQIDEELIKIVIVKE